MKRASLRVEMVIVIAASAMLAAAGPVRAEYNVFSGDRTVQGQAEVTGFSNGDHYERVFTTGSYSQTFTGSSGDASDAVNYFVSLTSNIPTNGDPITATASWTQDWDLSTKSGQVGGGVLHRAYLNVTSPTNFEISGTITNGNVYMWDSSYQNVFTPVGDYSGITQNVLITGTLSTGTYTLFWDSAIGGGASGSGHREGGFDLTFREVSVNAVPEPPSLALVGVASALAAGYIRWWRHWLRLVA